ncbi:hypothetical protein T01_1099 [Trichinella spiralis]|uniref:Uncharacterized protein n=1 Tax=Trichinella spiralis TaxID=6334 RepID=A0A0V1BHM3_TRISP|nr:hypothetical protein T01_1099 [Trichinella spiralis]
MVLSVEIQILIARIEQASSTTGENRDDISNAVGKFPMRAMMTVMMMHGTGVSGTNYPHLSHQREMPADDE